MKYNNPTLQIILNIVRTMTQEDRKYLSEQIQEIIFHQDTLNAVLTPPRFNKEVVDRINKTSLGEETCKD